jgi:hypothetical protein
MQQHIEELKHSSSLPAVVIAQHCGMPDASCQPMREYSHHQQGSISAAVHLCSTVPHQVGCWLQLEGYTANRSCCCCCGCTPCSPAQIRAGDAIISCAWLQHQPHEHGELFGPVGLPASASNPGGLPSSYLASVACWLAPAAIRSLEHSAPRSDRSC